MSETLEQVNDTPGSFLDVYRSLATANREIDEYLVDASVKVGVVPSAMRYGVMRRGSMEAYRGVVKGTDGSTYYFNWHQESPFKLVKADNENKQWDADRLFKSCTFGCDLLKADAPIEPGEAVDEDDEDDTEKAPGAISAVAPVSEEKWAQEQERMLNEVHPGATHAQTPDDPTRGKQWHEPIRRAVDGMAPLTAGDEDSSKHWDSASLMKAWGQKLQQSAPRVAPRLSDLETRYMREVAGATEQQIQKGISMTPRHRFDFNQWKTTQLRGRLSGLQSWLEKK